MSQRLDQGLGLVLHSLIHCLLWYSCLIPYYWQELLFCCFDDRVIVEDYSSLSFH